MAKNTNTQFGRKQWKDYLNKNWQPLGLGVIVGFIIRELLILIIVVALAFAIVMVLNATNKKHKEGGKV